MSEKLSKAYKLSDPPANSSRGKPSGPGQEFVLVAGHLRKIYQVGDIKVPALRGVDLQVRRGEFVAIMGPSGSGKSTLLHLISGLDRPTGGEVMLAGERLSTLDDESLSVLRRQKVGFVFQTFNLIPMLTAQENVMLPLLIDGRDPDKHRKRMDNLLQLVLIGDRKDHKPDQLSGGQQQRVAIARALITQPEIVMADEPTGNLDTRSGTVVLDLLRRVQEGSGTAIVMVTHDPRSSSYADRVVYLRDGKVVDQTMNRGDETDTRRIAERLAYLEEF
ncbi:MAG: ABC transporter ATP-binding protein [Anaerolineales bacterium]|nr:ABC transporter ATP-binding protein [Anaerolineales bacterium]